MREKHTLRIWMACRHAEPGSLNMCVECCAAERQAAADEARAEVERLREGLRDFGVHEHECTLGYISGGRPTEDGDYETRINGRWYRRDQWPKCSCGLGDLIAAALRANKEEG